MDAEPSLLSFASKSRVDGKTGDIVLVAYIGLPIIPCRVKRSALKKLTLSSTPTDAQLLEVSAGYRTAIERVLKERIRDDESSPAITELQHGQRNTRGAIAVIAASSRQLSVLVYLCNEPCGAVLFHFERDKSAHFKSYGRDVGSHRIQFVAVQHQFVDAQIKVSNATGHCVGLGAVGEGDCEP